MLPTLLSFNVDLYELCVCIWTSSAIYSYIHIYIHCTYIRSYIHIFIHTYIINIQLCVSRKLYRSRNCQCLPASYLYIVHTSLHQATNNRFSRHPFIPLYLVPLLLFFISSFDSLAAIENPQQAQPNGSQNRRITPMIPLALPNYHLTYPAINKCHATCRDQNPPKRLILLLLIVLFVAKVRGWINCQSHKYVSGAVYYH